MLPPLPSNHGVNMAFWDDVQSDLSEIFASDEGTETVTITPVAGAPFDCNVKFIAQVDIDRLISTRIMGDSAECRILHADVTTAGQTEPVAKFEGHPGWTISRADLNGNSEVWDVVDVKWSAASYWILTLERNVRFGR